MQATDKPGPSKPSSGHGVQIEPEGVYLTEKKAGRVSLEGDPPLEGSCPENRPVLAKFDPVDPLK